MRYFSIWCVGLGLAALTVTLTAQSGAGRPTDRAAVPLELGSGDGSHAVAHDSNEGSIVIGGQRTARRKACPVASRAFISTAFISKWSEDGRLLWHHDSESLFAGLKGLDPRYLLASTVHGLTVDPFTGEIFAVGEVLVGWQSASCESDGATARGTFMLRLAGDGTLLHDAYDLAPETEEPYPAPRGSAPKLLSICPADSGNVLNVTALGNTTMSSENNPERAVAHEDTCKLRISDGGDGNYGIDTELSLGTPIHANPHVNFSLQYLGEASRMDVLFQRASDGKFIPQQVLEFGYGEAIQTQIPVPSEYILPGNRLVVRLRNQAHGMTLGGNCEDDYEVDWIDRDS